MNKIDRFLNLLPLAKREHVIKELLTFLDEQTEVRFSRFQAEDLLNHFLQIVGKEIYNQAITDSRDTLKKRFEDLDVDLNLLFNQ